MIYLLEPLNNREIAVFLWTTLTAIGVLTIPGCRRSLGSILKIAASAKILFPILLMVAYVAGCVALFHRLQLWDPTLLRDTILWVCFAGILMLFNAMGMRDNDSFFGDTALDALKLVVVLEFIANVYVFPLPVELFAVPLVVIVAMLKAVAERDPKYDRMDSALGWVLGFYGLSALAISGIQIIANPSDILTLDALRSFLLPILLTFSLIPYVFVFALIAAYETAFLGLARAIQDPGLRRYAKLRLILRYHLNHPALKRWSRGGWPIGVRTKDEVMRLVLEKPELTCEEL